MNSLGLKSYVWRLLQMVQSDLIGVREKILVFDRNLDAAGIERRLQRLIEYLQTERNIPRDATLDEIVAEISAADSESQSQALRVDANAAADDTGYRAERAELDQMVAAWRDEAGCWNQRFMHEFLRFAWAYLGSPEAPSLFERPPTKPSGMAGKALNDFFLSRLNDEFVNWYAEVHYKGKKSDRAEDAAQGKPWDKRLLSSLKSIRRALCQLYPKNSLATRLILLTRDRAPKSGFNLCEEVSVEH